MAFTYDANAYRETNVREHPKCFMVDRGEQGAFTAEPYKIEILPYLICTTLGLIRYSVWQSYALLLNYKEQGNYLGMNIARKLLQMGRARARRYANHENSYKYTPAGPMLSQAANSQTSPKAESARSFNDYYSVQDTMSNIGLCGSGTQGMPI